MARRSYAEALRIAESALAKETLPAQGPLAQGPLAQGQLAQGPLAQGRLRWVAAQAALESGNGERSRTHLRALAESAHPLAWWAKLEWAERIAETEPSLAQTIVTPLEQGWPGAERARRVHARSLLAAGKTDDGIAALRKLLKRRSEDDAASEIAMPLAKALEAQANAAASEEALALYRRVANRAPLASVGATAAQRAATILSKLPSDRRDALGQEPADEVFVRATALYHAMQHSKAAALFASIAALPGVDAALACRARTMQGRALWRARDRVKTAEHMTKVATECASQDAKAWGHYIAGRALSTSGKFREAIQQYEAVEREAPRHELADDASLRAALGALELGDEAAMVKRLEALIERYPGGDMRPDALFRLAWAARRRGEHEKAVALFTRLDKEGSGERDEGIEGRTLYWRARSLVALGRNEPALRDYVAVFQTHPLSYYAQQSLQRIAEIDADRAARLAQPLRVGSDTLTFPIRPELERAPFQRALELLRVGAFDLASQELDAMGALGEGADRDALWLSAALFDRAGDSARTARLVRYRLRSFRRILPVGRSRALWRLAYPNAYSPLIEDAAQREGIPPAFVRAIAREESSFDPTAVSPAHAYGLVQLIEPTAKRHAKALGLQVNPRSLRDPATNVRIGARFMSTLWKRYAPNPAIVPAAYNAGEGAADRWLRERGDRSLDEWVEEIPFDETRRYTRRVLQTYGIYDWFETGRLPPIASALPKRAPSR